MNQKALIVISYYDRRPLNNLVELLYSIKTHSAGGELDVCIVVNRTKNEKICLPSEFSSIPVEYRHNLGMNIGAWDYGWRKYRGYQDYLFLQDECYVVRNDWLKSYRSVAEKQTIGMIGESLNGLWDQSWEKLREVFSDSELPEHSVAGQKVNRVDFYLNFFKEHAILPGKTGRHLRSVIWFFPGPVLEKMDGFLIGRNYGECIAAEIAASRKVEMIGLNVVQAHDEEFHYIRHLEYNQDRPGGAYSHNVKYVNFASIKTLLEVNGSEDLATKVKRLLALYLLK